MSLASLFVGKFLSSEGSEKAIFRTTLVAPARFTIFATAPFQIIPPLLASNYKSQSIGPLSQWIMARYLKTRGTKVGGTCARQREEEDALRAVIVHWLLGDTLECRRISSLPAVGRNSMGAPPKGIPTYLLEAPDLPSASCLLRLRRKRYFFGYYPVAGRNWCVQPASRLEIPACDVTGAPFSGGKGRARTGGKEKKISRRKKGRNTLFAYTRPSDSSVTHGLAACIRMRVTLTARRGDCITRTTRVLYNFAREISVSLCGRVDGVSSSIVRSIRVPINRRTE